MMPQKVPVARLGIEAFVIVASILLAFGIDAWWDNRMQVEREREVVAALTHEMTENKSLIEEAVGSHTRSYEVVWVFLEATPTDLGTLSPDSAVALGAALIGARIVTPLEGALNGEELSSLRSADLRRALGTWAGLAADQGENRPELFRLWTAMQRSYALVREDRLREPIDARVLQQLRADATFSSDLYALNRVRSGDRGKLVRLLAQTEEVLRLLELVAA